MLVPRARQALTRSRWPLPNPRTYTSRTTTTTTTSRHDEPLTLHYDLHPPPPPTPGRDDHHHPGNPIVFLHGLFGSSKNNRSISRMLARDLRRPVYCLDLRNHGQSPHSPVHDYTSMATDVEAFLTGISSSSSSSSSFPRRPLPTLIGHSMGAKVAMTVCLRHLVPVGSLVSIDNAPIDAALPSSFGTYCAGMRAVTASRARTSAEADAVLAKYEPDPDVRRFLATNLVRDDAGTGPLLRWRVPVDTLARNLGHVADFPFKGGDRDAVWKGPALFVRGTKSRYVADETLPVIGKFFPRFELRDIEAGHWVVSEKPEEFRQAVVEFLQDKE